MGCAAEGACRGELADMQRASPHATKARAERRTRERNPLLWFGNTTR
jgi:hypothetical protein